MHVHFEDADDVPVVLLFIDLQGSFADDFIGVITDGLPLGGMHDDLVLDLRGLTEAAGEEAGDQGKVADVVGLVEGDHEARDADLASAELLDVIGDVAALVAIVVEIAEVFDAVERENFAGLGGGELFAFFGGGFGLGLVGLIGGGDQR